jgi:LmbE family N-acetylglucosaminyl deacetylase
MSTRSLPKGFACALRAGFLAAAMLLAGAPQHASAADTPSGAQILQDLKAFNTMGTVLFIAAHPDDENTQLITYLARGRQYRTAYLSVTRGDGGQNLLGPEFGELLGVARTQELLAARRLDGGRQFFTRAIDFGYSKQASETLSIWDRQQVLGDVVRIIRTFKPDVVITRFDPDGSGTHGHHTASAILGREAFKLAGDATAYPDQVQSLGVWQPKRVLFNGGGGGGRGGAGGGNAAGSVRIDVGGNDPILGISFGEIANRSRGMHKTQGFGQGPGGGGGGRGGGGPRTESFTLLGGEAATNDIMDGIDTTWNRVGGNGAEIAKLTTDAIAKFDANNPAASIPALLAIKKQLTPLPADRIVDEKKSDLDQIIAHCLGLEVQTLVSQSEVVPGETIQFRHEAKIAANVPVKWVAVRFPTLRKELTNNTALSAGHTTSTQGVQTLSADTQLTQPYWLRKEPAAGIATVSDASLIGLPENPPVLPLENVFEIDGQTLILRDQPVQILAAAGERPETRRPIDVISPISIRFFAEAAIFKPGETRSVDLEVVGSRQNIEGAVKLEGTSGWKVEPASQPLRFGNVNETAKYSFTVTAPAQPAAGSLTASVTIGNATYSNRRELIDYPHIPRQLLQPPAKLKAVAFDYQTKGKSIGYIPGAGDSVADCLRQIGYTVTELTGSDLTDEKLKALDAVVIGIRAFNVRTDLSAKMPVLFKWVEDGGTLVEQYNRPGGNLGPFAPYSLQISGDRVTNENAPVQLLVPDHPALNVPNKIGDADFAGWVQERGIYYPNQWAEQFTPLLAAGDPEETPLKGGLLVARHGKGSIVYTGLVFFRELPAGVPGAYRLFANLVSLGK